MLDVLSLGALLACAAGLGTAILMALRVPREHNLEFRALSCAAGLGFLAVLLGIIALLGVLSLAWWLIAGGALATIAWVCLQSRTWRWPKWQRPSAPTAAVLFMLVSAAVGAIAPVTDDDSLAYALPIAARLAHEGIWRFWPDLARSVYPLSQELLVASLIGVGNRHLGLVSAVELFLTAVLIASLARRFSSGRSTPSVACIVALGCPAVAFLANSAKEDLLLTMMTVAGTLTLNLAPGLGAAAGAGLFAGLAAGAKYTGVPVALAIVACVPLWCGRQRPWSSLAAAALAATVAGGLWYAVNFARFGNPLVPFMLSIGSFPVSEATAAGWLKGFGYGRAPVDALLAPLRMVREVFMYQAGKFGGRANWINPLIWLGVPASLVHHNRRLMAPGLVISAGLYCTWFGGMQVARLLLPAAVLLSIPAADLLVRVARRRTIAMYAISLGLALSVGIVAAVGLVRAERYMDDPSTFVDRETPHYDAIRWMNTHLSPTHDRVGTYLRPAGYLAIPWMNLGSDFQVEIGPNEMEDPTQLRAALRRRGFTYVFGQPEEFEKLQGWLVTVYLNKTSRVGGAHFFREPPTEPVAVFALQ